MYKYKTRMDNLIKVGKTKKALPEPLVNYLEDQCKFAGVNIDDVDFDDKKWYLKHTITNRQEKDFREHFMKEVAQRNKRYYGLFRYVPKTKSAKDRAWRQVTLMYGFKRQEKKSK